MGRNIRPLSSRIEEVKRKLEKLELQDKIRELKAKFGSGKRRRRR